ncbi:hypothetical protein NPIL_215581, partial [Nephila pilipes]
MICFDKWNYICPEHSVFGKGHWRLQHMDSSADGFVAHAFLHASLIRRLFDMRQNV